jgi:4-hydroxy-2-oxoglutarate aldolase
MGAAGGVLALACFLPELCLRIHECFTSGDFATAGRLQSAVLGASRRIVADMGIPGVKYAMDCSGYFGGNPRPPFQPLSREQRLQIESLLSKLAAVSAVAAP